MNKELLLYLIRFLLGDDLSGVLLESIGYTDNRFEWEHYSVVIVPSGFFNEGIYGTKESLPQLPLQETNGIPLLFGSSKEEWYGSTWVVYADIIASSYFLLTRYEEMIRRDVRDEHGRFPGKESLPYRAGFIHRPIVDEYRRLLRRWLRQARVRAADVTPKLSRVYLTHDADEPTLYRSWKGLIRSVRDGRGLFKSIRGKFGSVENDPFYTFPWFFRRDGMLRDEMGDDRCKILLFVRSGGNTIQDKPHYDLHNHDIHNLIQDAMAHHALIGLHTSYQAGKEPQLIAKEKALLESNLGEKVPFNRHHFLRCREPEDMDFIEAAGFTDDFTMGYADISGFRLGTCHPVRWINPVTRRLSSLMLHPLIIMDSTLEAKKYLGLKYEEALAYSLNLAEQVKNAGGELNLLWHNTSVREETNSYLRKLYTNLLNELTKSQE